MFVLCCSGTDPGGAPLQACLWVKGFLYYIYFWPGLFLPGVKRDLLATSCSHPTFQTQTHNHLWSIFVPVEIKTFLRIMPNHTLQQRRTPFCAKRWAPFNHRRILQQRPCDPPGGLVFHGKKKKMILVINESHSDILLLRVRADCSDVKVCQDV